MAKETVDKIRKAMREIGKVVQERTGLKAWNSGKVPGDWGVPPQFDDIRVIEHFQDAIRFNAGSGDNTWALGIGVRGQLLSNGVLVLSTGYYLTMLIDGRDFPTGVLPQLWNASEEALNGAPTSEAIGNLLINGLRANLTDSLDKLSELLE